MKQTYVSSNVFPDVIDTCNYCHGSYGVKEKLDSFLNDHRKAKYEVCLHFMEFIEIKFPEIHLDETIHKEDILNFSEYPGKDMRIQFIYSYLVDQVEKIDKTDIHRRGLFIPEFSLNKDQLQHLLEKLKEKQFCYFTDVQKVMRNFYSNSSAPSEGKMKWLHTGATNNEINYRSVWLLLLKISSFDYVHANKHSLDNWLRSSVLYYDRVKKEDFLLKSYNRLNKQIQPNNGKSLEQKLDGLINATFGEIA